MDENNSGAKTVKTTTETTTSSNLTTQQQLNLKDGEIKELQKQVDLKNKELSKQKNSDDIAPGIRKTNTFGVSYRNGYEDGTVKKAIQAIKEERTKLQIQTK